MIKLKDLLKEYVDTDIVKLQQYLNSTSEQKADEIASMIGYKQLIDDYFIKNRGLYPKEINWNAGKETKSITQLYTETLALGKWNVLKQKDPVLYGAIVDWLMDKIYSEEQSFMSFMNGFGIEPAYIPSWFYLHEPTLVKNQWLVHGTSRMDGSMMARRGFIKGINDPTKLGLTTWLSGKKIGEGYNFAYTPEDFALYGLDDNELKYGDGTFLVFRASGIRCWHHADEEFQVIFHGKTARDIVFVDEVMGTYTIHSKKGKPLVQTSLEGKNSPVDLVNWVIDNYDQYRSSIGWEKSV